MNKVSVDKIIEQIINEGSVMVGMLPCNINPDEYNQPQWKNITSLRQLDIFVNEFMYDNCNEVFGDFPSYYLK